MWVNGQLQQMVYGNSATLQLAPGAYEVRAILGEAQHVDLGIPAGISVTIAEAGPGTPMTTPPVAPDAASAYSVAETQNNAFLPIAAIGAALLAAIAGRWVGARLPKGRR